MEVSPGYKLTEAGVIPDDWYSTQLGAFVTLQRGHDLTWRDRRTGEVPVMGSAGHNGFHNVALAKGPGVVLGRSGASFGQAHYCHDDYWPHNTALYVIDFMDNDPLFAYYFLRAFDFTRHNSGGAQQSLNRNFIAPIPVGVPEPSEQRAIAAALSDVDALLDRLELLIAKKRDLKQAAMQQLLTGQTRLPGFHGDWEVKRLGELGTFLKGSGVRKDEALTGELPCVRYGELYTHHNDYIRSFNSWISYAVAGTATALRRGDLLFACSGETKEEIGKCVALIDDVKAYAGGDIAILRPAATDSLFLGYLLNSPAIAAQKASLGQGDAVVHISARALASIVLSLPSFDEQTAIAAILCDMDAELSVLEARRDKTRALKQGMMQELLTGRTRLVVPATVNSGKNAQTTESRGANIHFRRSVLAAEIIDRLHEEPTFGHVKFEKIIFLVEHLCDVETGSTYHRDAAGPYDNRAVRSIDSQLRKQKWFDAQKTEGRYRYQPMTNRGKHKEYFERYFAEITPIFDRVIETFRDFETERCEIVATLFSAWNDLLLQNKPASDDAIVNEVLHHWHESKKRIPEDRWRKALSWMRDHGFVPHPRERRAST